MFVHFHTTRRSLCYFTTHNSEIAYNISYLTAMYFKRHSRHKLRRREKTVFYQFSRMLKLKSNFRRFRKNTSQRLGLKRFRLLCKRALRFQLARKWRLVRGTSCRSNLAQRNYSHTSYNNAHHHAHF